MSKFITFVLDSFDLPEYEYAIFPETVKCHSYCDTEKAIKAKEKDIWTYDLSHLSFDLINMGYTIIIAHRGKLLTCYPGMDSMGQKEIKKGHNLLKLLLGGYFDDDLEIRRK